MTLSCSLFSISFEWYQLKRMVNLRWLFMLVELVFLAVYINGNANASLGPFIFVLVAQLAIQAVSVIWLQKNWPVTQTLITAQLSIDLLLLTLLLYATGGATNAYVSLLLLPIALAAVALSTLRLLLILALSVLCYSSLLFWLPTHVQHIHDMQSHFVGMWINFLFSALVVVFVVAAMARELRQREHLLAEQKQQTLREQQVLALGVAAAQTVHELATPVATLALLHEELAEQFPEQADIQAMNSPLARCKHSLQQLRQVADELRQNKSHAISPQTLFELLVDQVALTWPEIPLVVEMDFKQSEKIQLQTNGSVLPALMNLVQNAVQFSSNKEAQIRLHGFIASSFWCCQITNVSQMPQRLSPSLSHGLTDPEAGF